MSPVTLNSMDTYKSNLDYLQEYFPALAEKFENFQQSGAFSLEPTRQGIPTLTCKFPDGKILSLHSRYNPAQEASQFINTLDCQKSSNFIVFGLGLGYHIVELIKKAPRHSKILVVEGRTEIFKYTMQCEHFTELLHRPNIRWLIGEDARDPAITLSDWKDSFALNGFLPVRFQPLTQFNSEFCADFEKTLGDSLRETQVSHNTRRALSRILYQNCFQNFKSSINSPGIVHLEGIANNEPVLVVAAGPSLDKNIQLIRGIQNSCRIIAVSTALKPLQEAGIEPDFVVAIDPKPVSSTAFENANPSSKTSLVFNPVIPENITDQFPGKRFVIDAQPYLWKFLNTGATPKGELGESASVAHTALNLALHMGCTPIILVGQDLSFQSDRSHCSGAFHKESLVQNIGTNQTSGRLHQRQRGGTASAARVSQDFFGNTISTTNALESFRFPFEKIKKSGTRLVNATEGGVNLSGIENATLKEILAGLTILKLQKTTPTKNRAPSGNIDLDFKQKLARQITDQTIKLDKLLSTIQIWLNKNKPIQQGLFSENILNEEALSEQISAAETILASIIQDKDSVQLLQEYLYSEFLDWNRETYQIELLKNDVEQTNRKLKRDFVLFSEIEATIKWFQIEFGKLLE